MSNLKFSVGDRTDVNKNFQFCPPRRILYGIALMICAIVAARGASQSECVRQPHDETGKVKVTRLSALSVQSRDPW